MIRSGFKERTEANVARFPHVNEVLLSIIYLSPTCHYHLLSVIHLSVCEWHEGIRGQFQRKGTSRSGESSKNHKPNTVMGVHGNAIVEPIILYANCAGEF